MSALNRRLHIQEAKSLPAKLQRFFAINPPTHILPSLSTLSTSSSNHPPSPPGEQNGESIEQLSQTPPQERPNPFQPFKNPETGRWRPAKYSMRQQADLVKLAEKHQVEELLPFTRKLSSERLRKRVEEGIRMKGTGVGQKVKGHLWERQLKGKLEKRRQAMLAMPQMIQTWRQVSFSLVLLQLLQQCRGH